ncbi:MAG: helix-turn-helix domain-containing protein [Chitinivibrionales bacterium]|nr:helix-turn-helix domain-containing protein [Chitinivibrionales bacterium]MBD3358880.1 helix-turn-helix domain-containing protein [Chitinivibrionales bacterium]
MRNDVTAGDFDCPGVGQLFQGIDIIDTQTPFLGGYRDLLDFGSLRRRHACFLLFFLITRGHDSILLRIQQTENKSLQAPPNILLRIRFALFIITVMNTVEMQGPSQRLGRILRSYREKRGHNQRAVAAKAGISTSMLSQIERGAVSPSIDTLYGVCSALGVDIADLFGQACPRAPVRIHHPGERLQSESERVRYEQLVSSPDTAFPGEMFLLELKPHTKVGPSDGGHEGVEMGYVLSGTAVLTVESNHYTITRGDSLAFSSRLRHGLENTGVGLFQAVWSTHPPHQDYLKLE